MENQSEKETTTLPIPDSTPPLKTLSSPKNKLSLISGGIVLLLLIGGILYLGMRNNPYNKNQNTQQSATSNLTSDSTRSDTSDTDDDDWKSFAKNTLGIAVSYPPTWVTPENSFISEKQFVPGEQDKSKIYNIIEIQKYSTPIYAGYTNSEWFDKINSSTIPISDQREMRTKLTSGTVESGEHYVIFTDEPSATAQSEGSKQVKAYILKEQTVYQLTLDMYDQNGLNIFRKIVPTAIIY